MTLAEIAHPMIDPVVFRIGSLAVRWYGISYILAFALAYLVLVRLAKQGRWPVAPDRVGDVLFWGILGVFLGGRVGYMLFYATDKSLGQWHRVTDGGMSFHGGLLGVIIAYFGYALVKRIRFRDLADGLALATPLGIASVRFANFINGELPGRLWDGPWSMRFPIYDLSSGALKGMTELRHPSQLYEMLGEGLLLFVVVWFVSSRLRWRNGRVASVFVLAYGLIRFGVEFFREPDKEIGYLAWHLTEGQWFCLLMVALGIGFLAWTTASERRPPLPAV